MNSSLRGAAGRRSLGEDMRLRSAFQLGRLTAGALLVALVACGRTPPPAASLKIETPQLSEGQTLGVGRDADPQMPGFQLDVEIRVTDAKGEDVPLSNATLSWGVRGEGDFSAPASGTVDGSRATFPRLTLPPSAISLRVQVAEKGGSRTQTLERNVTLSFDDTRPQVIGWSLPSDANGDGILNVSELGRAAAVLQIETEGVGGGHVLVRERETQRELGAANIAADGVSLSLTGLAIDVERAVAFEIVLTNSLGNLSDTAQNPEAVGTFTLDGIAPTVTLLAPTLTLFGPAHDAAPGTAGYQLRARAQTSADVGSDGLSFSLTPGQTVLATPATQEAEVTLTVPASGEHTYALTVVATDAAGNASAPVTRTLTVDLVAPVITVITSPASGSTHATSELPIDVSVTGAEGRALEVFRRIGSTQTQVGTLQVSGGKAVGTLSFVNGTFDVVVRVADAAGNQSEAEVGSVTVEAPGCAIAITTPSSRPKQYLLVDDQNAAVAGLQTKLVGNSPGCVGQQVSLSRNGGGIEATAQVMTNGTFTFPVTLADGEASRLTVSVTNAALATSNDFVDVMVDLTPATIDVVEPEAASLNFVGETNVNLGQPGFIVDAIAGGDAQASFVVTVSGATGGFVVATYRGAPVSAQLPVSESPQSLTVPLELPHGTTGSLGFEVRDASGNVTAWSRPTAVDVVAPATPTVSANITNARRATVEVSWTASGDDGTTGNVAGYDFRYSTDAVLPNGIQTEEEFFGSEDPQPTSKRVGTGLLPATPRTQTLTLPPFARYSFQVRAVDEMGNYSEFVGAPMVSNIGQDIVLTNPGTGARFGWKIATADFDQDGVADLAVANDDDASTTGAVHLYRGGPTLVDGTPWMTITPPTAGSQYFGTSIATGSVDGDAVPDLIVGASTWKANRGRALLYFGQAGLGPDLASPIEFRGQAGITGFFGSVVNVLPDLNGDGRSELAVTASSDNGGRVYLFFGRTRAAWAALAENLEGDGNFIPFDRADAVIQGPALVNNQVVLFGRDAGAIAVGDLNGDGVTELAVAASRSSVGTVFIFSGAFVGSRSGPTLVEKTVKVSDAIETLGVPLASTQNLGFGFEMRGGVGLSGPGVHDLVVALPRASEVHLYSAANGGSFGTRKMVLDGPSGRYFGNGLAAGDVNGDGAPDLLIGENAPATVTSSQAWILYHQGDPAAPFEEHIPGFSMSRLRWAQPLRGLDLEVVDLTGDGLPDVVSTDMRSSPGRVYVHH